MNIYKPASDVTRRRMPAIFLGLLLLLVVAATSHAQSNESEGWRFFAAELSAENQTVLTDSPGTGSAEFTLELASLNLSWDVSFADLTSPVTAVHIHGPAQPGTNAPPMIDLAPEAVTSSLKGGVRITESQVQYMLQGWTYVSIHTQMHPNGEIRGKVHVKRPPK